VAAKAEVAVAHVVQSITDMGLKVAANKTEAIFLYGKASGKPPHARKENPNPSRWDPRPDRRPPQIFRSSTGWHVKIRASF